MENKGLHNLLRIRKEKGLTGEELAKLSGLGIATIHRLETGETPIGSIKLGTLMKLSKVLKCKVADLLPQELQSKVR